MVSLLAFAYGVPVGFAFSIALGPVFFSLIKSSVEHGFKAALWIACGVILADMCLLAFAYGGVEAFLPTQGFNVAFWAQFAGGLLLLGLGMANFIKKTSDTEGGAVVATRLAWKNLSQGFFLNILNPANFFEWVGTASILKSTYHFDTPQSLSFFAGALLAVFMTEVGVAYFASRLRQWLSVQIMQYINWGSGLLFSAFGLWLLYQAFWA